jgi:diguanylate cyclase (GGDEF)-like protein
MPHNRSLLQRLAKPKITTKRELVRYVLLVNLFALLIALAIDVTQQLMFFQTWAGAFRSWALTVFAAGIIATPVALAFGVAQRDLQLAKSALEEMSRTDPLTGLPNRRALMEVGEVSTSQTMVLVITDIDYFKAVNDSYGHKTGDIVLQTISRIMADHLKELGLVGRLGGEEFALICSNISIERVMDAVGKLLDKLQRTPVIAMGHSVRVTMSAGIAVRSPSEPFDKLYSDADEALYRAKRAGRNRIELSSRASKEVMASASIATLRS